MILCIRGYMYTTPRYVLCIRWEAVSLVIGLAPAYQWNLERWLHLRVGRCLLEHLSEEDTKMAGAELRVTTLASDCVSIHLHTEAKHLIPEAGS